MSRIARNILLYIAIAAALLVILLASGYGYERFAEYRDLQRHPPPGRLIEFDSRKVHLYCQGVGSPTVIIETGAGSPSFLWWNVQEAVAKSTHVCTYDRAGFGWSDAAPMERSIKDRAIELHQVLTRGGVSGPYVLVAHSYGALIALDFTREHRNEIAGLVFVDAADQGLVYSPTFLQGGPIEAAAYRKMAWATCFGIRRMYFARMTKEKQSKELGVSQALLERIGLTAAGLSTGYAYEYADEMNSFLRTPVELRRSGTPGSLGTLPLVVLKHGLPFTGSLASMEQEWNQAQDRLTKLSTRSELRVASNSSHAIYRDEPEAIVAAVHRVLGQNAGP